MWSRRWRPQVPCSPPSSPGALARRGGAGWAAQVSRDVAKARWLQLVRTKPGVCLFPTGQTTGAARRRCRTGKPRNHSLPAPRNIQGGCLSGDGALGSHGTSESDNRSIAPNSKALFHIIWGPPPRRQHPRAPSPRLRRVVLPRRAGWVRPRAGTGVGGWPLCTPLPPTPGRGRTRLGAVTRGRAERGGKRFHSLSLRSRGRRKSPTVEAIKSAGAGRARRGAGAGARAESAGAGHHLGGHTRQRPGPRTPLQGTRGLRPGPGKRPAGSCERDPGCGPRGLVRSHLGSRLPGAGLGPRSLPGSAELPAPDLAGHPRVPGAPLRSHAAGAQKLRTPSAGSLASAPLPGTCCPAMAAWTRSKDPCRCLLLLAAALLVESAQLGSARAKLNSIKASVGGETPAQAANRSAGMYQGLAFGGSKKGKHLGQVGDIARGRDSQALSPETGRPQKQVAAGGGLGSGWSWGRSWDLGIVVRVSGSCMSVTAQRLLGAVPRPPSAQPQRRVSRSENGKEEALV